MLISHEITNFTEILVEEAVNAMGLEHSMDNELLQDVVCLALNKLPAHYVRSTMDVRINLALDNQQPLLKQVDAAIAEAINVVSSGRRESSRP